MNPSERLTLTSTHTPGGANDYSLLMTSLWVAVKSPVIDIISEGSLNIENYNGPVTIDSTGPSYFSSSYTDGGSNPGLSINATADDIALRANGFDVRVDADILRPEVSNATDLGSADYPFKGGYIAYLTNSSPVEVHTTATAGKDIVNYETMTNKVNDGTLAADFATGRFRQEVVEVIGNTNAVQLTLDDGGKCYVYNGTNAECTVSLPTGTVASVGTDFRFINVTTNLLTIDAVDADYIDDSDLGAQIYSGIDGTNYWPYSSITLKQAESNWWHSLAARGDWTTTGTNTPAVPIPAPVRGIGGFYSMTPGVTNQTVSYGAEYTTDMWPVVNLTTSATFQATTEIVSYSRSNFVFRLRGASSFVTNGWDVIWNSNPAP